MLRDRQLGCAPRNTGLVPTIGLPHRVNGRLLAERPLAATGQNGGGGGAATSGGGFSGGGRRGGMPHYVAVTPSGCHTGRAEVSGVMQEGRLVPAAGLFAPDQHLDAAGSVVRDVGRPW